jgi:aerobic carbon-monoxide dehydrogenase medium subunit
VSRAPGCRAGVPVKPAPFGYHRASSVAQAVEYLSAYEGTARLLAGGQSLAPMLNMRLLRPDALIDINGIEELTAIRCAGDQTVIGAMVRYVTLEYAPVIAARLPLLARVVGHIGDRQVRNRGTIGGSLAQGDPTGEMPLACLALGARVRAVGPDGRRDIGVDEFYAGSYATVLDPREVLTEVIFPPAPAYCAFAESCRRHNDFAVISVACVGDRTAAGRWSAVRIALGGVADTPVIAGAASEMLVGSELPDSDIAAAAQAALAVADPPNDIRASAEYRRHLVPVYVRRVLTQLRSAGAGPAAGAGPGRPDREDRP